jgi:uncharacterized protein (DUF427 family)
MKATWNGATIAESDATVVVESNHYFPPDSVDAQYLRDSATTTVCSWKGTASYADLVVDDSINADATWIYRDPEPEAAHIAGYYAFWKGVVVS